jgi:cell division septation protein DedD
VLVTIVSAASLALGFFVGRASVDTPAVQVLEAAAQEAGPAAAAEESIPDPLSGTRTAALPEDAENSPFYAGKADAPEGSEEEAEEAPQAVPRARRQRLPPPKKHPAETKQAAPEGEYTVQVGAFLNDKDARGLKDALARSGYKAYVFATRDGEMPIYKVRVGSYESEDEARLTALAIRKAEGVAAFVTPSR